MKEETKPIGWATDEQVAAWKKIHNCDTIHEIEVKGHVCYVRELDRQTMKYVLSLLKVKVDTDSSAENQTAEMDMEKVIEIGETVLQNCCVGGSEEIKTKDSLWIPAAIIAGEIFEIAEGNVKKR